MTAMPKMPTRATCAASDDDPHVPGPDLAPGVEIERRALLWVPVAAAASVLLGGGRRSLAQGAKRPAPAPGLAWDDFIRQCVPLATELVKDASPGGQDAYLHGIASLAVHLKAAPESRLFAFGGLDPRVEFGPSYRGVPFYIIQWRMAPHALLPAHCHPQSSVCTLGLEGAAWVRNFHVHGEAPAFDSGSSRPFQIQETQHQLITPRRVNTLSASRDNIHHFVAGSEGARGIDIMTMYGGSGKFSFLAFDPDKPIDKARRIYEAVWTGQEP